MFIESPIVVIVGNKGSGKTLFLTFMAESAHAEGRKVYSNYTLHNIPYEKFTYHQLVNLPESMENGVILMDEGHMGSDAYDFLNKRSRAITTLATQLRKRKLDLYITTQRFTFISSRLRELTDYILAFDVMKDIEGHLVRGVALVEVYDRNNGDYMFPMNKFYFDGRSFFGHYNTEEVIFSGDPIDDGEEVN